METQMLRATINKLEQLGEIEYCNTQVDPKFELGAVLRYFSNRKPIMFNKPKGYDMPVLGGLYGNRELYYKLMNDVTSENRLFRFMDAIANPQPAKMVNNGPIKENIVTGNIDIPRMFPVPTSHEKDSGAFITAGMFIVRDPETGYTHMAVRRFQINGGNSISALVSGHSPALLEQFAEFEKINKPLECAVVLGYDATYLLASQIGSRRYGLDKHEVDSALRGEPLELVKCHTVDLEVPAYAEMVLEGVLVPNKRVIEGPFGELMGYYGEVAPNPVMEVKCIMHRNNAIFQHAFPCREEHLANGLIREAELYAAIKNATIDVQDVNITVGAGCRLHAIISIKKRKAGDAKTAILAALGSSYDIKHVVIVDEDINIYDSSSVELALSSRVQASQDVVIVPGALGSGLESSHVARGVTDKMGIDATKPLGEYAHLFEMAIIPGFEGELDIEKYLPGIKNK
ncbi:UbiD family decarboxylase [Gottschalkia acidurici 9a]|uniref:UbiD family decarboxylase n=1 Tax=Gottschalkia acidurici (strain ATCC 7906 / DSM 604 / BCRC 14475 / CIP 104303 / KCTC 5404 / NCIMB 10678 / 9a) TaxID=1128398 RepID=K0B5Y1_GOTA9|nr:UbiD family decarboxylase [Gottschalkia acidurici]AFS79876.1 UbiD family decarboxylase [Gottschalkia acidurici 9a]